LVDFGIHHASLGDMARRSLVDLGFVKKGVNLSTIAKKLGVSTTTVSRALRQSASIHPVTRDRVLELARVMGYQPKSVKVVSPSRTKNILVLSQAHNAAVDTAYLSGLSDAAMALNVSLLTHHYPPNACERVLDPESQPHALRTGEVEGIVLLHRWPIEVVEKLAKQYPLVSVIHAYREVPVDLVGIEERGGMLALVDHLISQGHRQMGFIGLCRSMSWSGSRFAAFVEALALRKIDYDPKNVISTSMEETLAENPIDIAGVESLVARSKSGVKAWIASSENIGLSVYYGLTKKGIKLPEEIALAGFHASQASGAYSNPVLTTTLASSFDLGKIALARLMERIQNPDECQRSILIASTFFPGQTT
jgi:LacI family transcriptional regulator